MARKRERVVMTAKNTWILTKAAASSWVDDYAQSMGAALAYYTMLSIAPFLLIVISLAGMIFGVEAARGEIAAQLQGRSEERRVGKECRSRWGPCDWKKTWMVWVW